MNEAPSAPIAPPGPAAGGRTATPYRRVWRWHFFAGLFVAPLLLMLALTGGLYLFDAEIDDWWQQPHNRVQPLASARPLAEQEAAVQAAYPGARLQRYVHPAAADRAAQWSLTTQSGQALDVFVDPYRAQVQGVVPSDWRPMAIVASLHGELMLGTVGDWLVEAAASWTLVLVATGLYLWWPRQWRLAGVWWPRWRAGGRRYWRDLHAVPGAINALALVFLVLSGLPWAGFWGGQLASLGTLNAATAPSPNFSAPPGRETPSATADQAPASGGAGHVHDPDDVALPWAIRHAPVPAGSGGSGFTLQQVMDLAVARGVRADLPRLRLVYPQGDQGVYMVSHVPDRAQDQRTIYLDPRDGRVIDDIGWGRYSPLARVVEWSVMVHLGRQFGLANQLLGLLVCLLIVGAVVAGGVLWWRRRPAGGLGAPQAPAREHLPGGLKALLLLLGLVFPLVALSFCLVWGVDWLMSGRARAAPT